MCRMERQSMRTSGGCLLTWHPVMTWSKSGCITKTTTITITTTAIQGNRGWKPCTHCYNIWERERERERHCRIKCNNNTRCNNIKPCKRKGSSSNGNQPKHILWRSLENEFYPLCWNQTRRLLAKLPPEYNGLLIKFKQVALKVWMKERRALFFSHQNIVITQKHCHKKDVLLSGSGQPILYWASVPQ